MTVLVAMTMATELPDRADSTPTYSTCYPGCREGNCLKSSWSGVSTVNLWADYQQEMVLLPRFTDSRSFHLRPIRTFQTVSGVSSRKLRGCESIKKAGLREPGSQAQTCNAAVSY